MRRFVTISALLTTILIGPVTAEAGGGCHSFTEGTASDVTIVLNCFGPTVTHIDVGTEVAWTNSDGWDHNIYSSGFTGSDTLGYGDSFAHRFDEAGAFPYVCTFHPSMMGVVVVGDAAAATQAVTPEPVAITTTVAAANLVESGEVVALGPSSAETSQSGPWTGLGYMLAGGFLVGLGLVAGRLMGRRPQVTGGIG